MFGRRIVPMVLAFGVLHYIMHQSEFGPHGLHGAHSVHGAPGEGEKHGPFPFGGPFSGPRGEWGKRVPPMFERWHKLAHEAQSEQPSAPAI